MTKQQTEYLDKYDKIYSMIPDYFKLKNIKEKVSYIQYRELRKYFDSHKGMINARPLNTIAKELGFSNSGNSVTFRNVVAELVEIELYPIASCSNGYFKAVTPYEIAQNIETEAKRIKGVKRRVYALNKIIREGL